MFEMIQKILNTGSNDFGEALTQYSFSTLYLSYFKQDEKESFEKLYFNVRTIRQLTQVMSLTGVSKANILRYESFMPLKVPNSSL